MREAAFSSWRFYRYRPTKARDKMARRTTGDTQFQALAVIASRGKRIVLTGVSRGLGQAMVQGFIAAGHTVCGCARDKQAIARLRKRWPAPNRFSVVDVSDDASVRRWARASLEQLGGVDLLVNNAGVINANAPLWEISAAELSKVVDVNIKGVANVIRHFVPAMIRRRSGVIVNFSSGWGRSVAPQVAPYCASKWAVEGLTRALAQELPKGMAAVALNPGIIDTQMLRSCFGASAGLYPDVENWSRRAIGFILNISAKDNGEPLTVPRR
jgi:NAD(P)-dependent dehydrogenase (short-subunit alcohol dehydrogenase family)